jgi:predicted transcriptional regulator of viral defense system
MMNKTSAMGNHPAGDTTMPAVPTLYQAMYARQVFTTAEAAEALGRPSNQVARQVSYLKSQGYLVQVRRGLHAIVPIDARGSPPPPNPYLVASKLTDPYVLSYHTALELHGVAQSTFYTVHVATSKRFRPFTHRGVRFLAVRATPQEVKAAATQLKLADQRVKVASREWTVAHCALRLDLAGGFEEFLKSVAGFAYLRPERLLEAATLLGRKILYHRLGFLLDTYRKRWHVSTDDLDLFRANLGDYTDYFGARPGHARYVREWNLMVPDNLEQVIRPG